MRKLILSCYLLLNSISFGQETYISSLKKGMVSFSITEQIDTIHAIPFDVLNSNIKQSIEIVETALEMSQSIDDKKRTAESFRILSLVYYYDGDYEESTQSALNSIHLFEELNDLSNAGNIYAILGYQTKRRDLKKSFSLMKKGIILLEKDFDSLHLSAVYNNFGVLHEMNADLDSALHYYNKGLSIVVAFKDSIGLSYGYSNIAGAYLLKDDFQKSKEFYDKAFAIRKERNDLSGLAESYESYGNFYRRFNKINLAIANYLKSFEISVQINYPFLCQKTQENLAQLYELKGNYKKALVAQQKATVYKDKIVTEQRNRAIAELEIQFETEKKQKKLVQKDLTIQRQNQAAATKTFGLIGLSIFIVLLTIIGLFIYAQQKLKQQKLKDENQLKDQIAQEKLKNELHDERLRISSDLHDNIGSQLTFIISSVDNLKYSVKSEDEKLNNKLTTISQFTSTTITQLRDTIWALNKDDITIEDLSSRLVNYIENAKLAESKIAFSVVSNLTKNIILNAVQGVNTYRIVQEAINNTIKHAAASKIEVLIKEDATSIYFIIKDNGIGFEISQIKPGNGLENMKRRAEKMGVQFDLKTTNGVEVKLTFSKNKLNAV